MSKLKERGEGSLLVTMNAHVKYKNTTCTVSAVMVKVEVFVQSQADADTGMTIALRDIRSSEHKRDE